MRGGRTYFVGVEGEAWVCEGRTYIVGVEGEAWVCEGREDVHCGSGGGGVGL